MKKTVKLTLEQKEELAERMWEVQSLLREILIHTDTIERAYKENVQLAKDGFGDSTPYNNIVTEISHNRIIDILHKLNELNGTTLWNEG